MKIKELIAEINIKRVQYRKDALTKMKSPDMLITKCQEQLDSYANLTFKVNGMARKHKVADVEVLDYTIQVKEKQYYGVGNRSTLIVIMNTEKGKFYYDSYANKIADNEYL